MSEVIHSIHHERGDINSVSSLPAILENPSWGRYLDNLGIESFSRMKAENLIDYLRTSISSTLSKGNIKGSDVDAVILFSTTFDPYTSHSDFAKLSVELGIDSAIPYGMFHNQCTNFSQAIEFAQLLLRGQGLKRILLVGFDILDETKGERVMDNRVSVYSDVVVSCLLETGIVSGWEIETVQHKYLPVLSTYTSAQDIVNFIKDYSRGVTEVVDKAYKKTNSSAEDFDLLITANYNHSVVKNLAELSGISDARMDLSAISDYAHCFSADHLITLQHRFENKLLSDGERSLLLAVGGFVIFSATSVKWRSA